MQEIDINYIIDEIDGESIGISLKVNNELYFIHFNKEKYPGIRKGTFPIELDKYGNDKKTRLVSIWYNNKE